MLESELCSSRIFSTFREESCDEELAVLPRHTKVIVTGNNRTKSVLVGLQGVVKKAVGLGGWHWLVLKNGIEVKLQRNALSVLEHPTGDEVDEDIDFDASSGSEIGQKHYDCSRGNKIYRPRVRHTKPWFPSAPVKSINHSSYRDVQSIIQAHQQVNFGKLGTDTLWRYIKHYKLCGVHRDSPREQMLQAVQQHFLSQGPLDEVQVVTEFVRAAKKPKSV